MYVNCIFCRAHLGSNELIEHFPVGRRLAFDSARGRLWVVCRACARWNLTPLEERWEAIEECERIFGATRTRVSTDQIGLGRTSEGLELVRIGDPLRPEFAAWRYGEQFRRRRRNAVVVGTGLVAASAVIGATVALPVITAGAVGTLLTLQTVNVANNMREKSLVARISTGPRSLHKHVDVRLHHVRDVRLEKSHDSNDIEIHVPSDQGEWLLKGERALAALRLLLPAVNSAGSWRSGVKEAVAAVERSGDPRRYLLVASKARTRDDARLRYMPHEVKLALEMAVNEETERAALEGELAELEAAWRAAEEIAGIADDMFLPEWINRFIERNRRQ